jgi:hypothetical protein
MKLPDLMILPIFNETAADGLRDSILGSDSFVEEESKKLSQR